jgi:hypothetical protein
VARPITRRILTTWPGSEFGDYVPSGIMGLLLVIVLVLLLKGYIPSSL